MKRYKRGFIDSEKLISKSEYAKEIGITPAAIDKQVNKGYLVVVKYKGGEVIYRE